MKLKLRESNSYSWKNIGKVYIKGELRTHNSLFSKLNEVNDFPEFAKIIRELDGLFSIILEREDSYFLAVDKIRTFPLFFGIPSSPWPFLSDYLDECDFRLTDINQFFVDQFINAGFVMKGNTIFKGVKQLRGGEALQISRSGEVLEKADCFDFSFKIDPNIGIDDVKKMYSSLFKDLIRKIDERPVLVPLSGGFDSREIVLNLKELGYSNVQCFTYGNKNSPEPAISRDIAKYFGYKWNYVHYSRKKWFKWYHSEHFQSYLSFARNGTSLGHTQDYPAIYELHENNLIKKDSVIIPGHSADFNQGSHLPKWILNTEKHSAIKAAEYLSKSHFDLWDNQKSFISEIIKEYFTAPSNMLNIEDCAEKIEVFDWQERQIKFILNSIRVYDYFGYKCLIPFWDKKFVNFWLSVPIHLKKNRRLYYEYVTKYHNRELAVANKSQSLIRKAVNKFTDDWHGRLNGNQILPFALLQKNSAYLKNKNLIAEKYLNSYVYATNKIGINSVLQYDQLLTNLKK